MALGALSLALCAPAWAASDAEVEEMRRAVMELRAQNRELTRRLNALEAEAEQQRRRPATAQRGAPAVAPPPPVPVARAPQREEARPAPPPGDAVEGQGPREPGRAQLEQRVRDLEIARAAQEAATRSVIRDALSSVGPNINQNIALGGQIEVRVGRFRDFEGPTQEAIDLSTAELDFDIKLGDWVFGSLLLGYEPGGALFTTSTGITTPVDRVNVERAMITIGDTQRFPLFVRAGRDVLPFGTSTGVSRLDSPSITGPLTIDAFEARREAIGIGFAFPTPPLAPAPPPVVIPPVRPLVVAPLVGSMARFLGYRPPPTRPQPLTPVPRPPVLPPFYGSVYLFSGDPDITPDRPVTENFSARAGYRTEGSCGRLYEELRDSWLCPWSLDFHVDYISSVFDSNFLRSEYGPFLRQIGAIPGMATSLKASAGPFLFVGEVNTALKTASFLDDAGRRIRMHPAAWQLALAYQFDWNPWMEQIGEQGTFVAVTYSGTRDLAGVTQLAAADPTAAPTRIGFLPRHRLAFTAGEWVLPGVRLAAEAAISWDYGRRDGGTGNTVAGFFTSLILAF
jgi:hypothetical protein